jgi:hypothetical protein
MLKRQSQINDPALILHDIKLYSFYRIARLYEQGADINRIRDYVKKWLQWANGLGAEMSLYSICLYKSGLTLSVPPRFNH